MSATSAMRLITAYALLTTSAAMAQPSLPRPWPPTPSPPVIPFPPDLPPGFRPPGSIDIGREAEIAFSVIPTPSPPNQELICAVDRLHALLTRAQPRANLAPPVVGDPLPDGDHQATRDALREWVDILGIRLDAWVHDRAQHGRLIDARTAIPLLTERVGMIPTLTADGHTWPPPFSGGSALPPPESKTPLSPSLLSADDPLLPGKPIAPWEKLPSPSITYAFSFEPLWRRVRDVASFDINEVLPLGASRCEVGQRVEACLASGSVVNWEDCPEKKRVVGVAHVCAAPICASSPLRQYCESGHNARGSGCAADPQHSGSPYFRVARRALMSRDAAAANVEAFTASVEALRDPLESAIARFAGHIETERGALSAPAEALLARLAEEAERLADFAADNLREGESLVALAAQVETHRQALAVAMTQEQTASADVQRAARDKASANEALDDAEAAETATRGALEQALRDLAAFQLACGTPGSQPAEGAPPPCPNQQTHDRELERRYALIEVLGKRQDAWLIAMQARVDRLEAVAAADTALATHLAALTVASGEVLEHRTGFEALSREHASRSVALEAAEALHASLEEGRRTNVRAVESWRDLLAEAIPSLSEATHVH